jgi:hypothetical protein
MRLINAFSKLFAVDSVGSHRLSVRVVTLRENRFKANDLTISERQYQGSQNNK